MKRVGNLMSQISSVENLLLAYHKASRGKRHKASVVGYSRDLYENILMLRKQIIGEMVVVGEYHYFNISDPKPRLICAASFPERVLHHAIINVCKPHFERHLIYDTYATRDNKGIYAAIDRAQMAIKRYDYVAKLDVRKYFDSISHNILKSRLGRLFKDEALLRLLYRIIDSYSSSEGRGLPIGNLTSQYFANYYLSFCDHYIKECLRVPFYVRYMDDMLLFGKTKEEVREYVNSVTKYLSEEFSLELKCPQILRSSDGVSFLGYKLKKGHLMLNTRSKARFKCKMYLYDKYYKDGVWDEVICYNRIVPLLAFTRKAETYNLRSAVCRKLNS